jgi:hypothetical protein
MIAIHLILVKFDVQPALSWQNFSPFARLRQALFMAASRGPDDRTAPGLLFISNMLILRDKQQGLCGELCRLKNNFA